MQASIVFRLLPGAIPPKTLLAFRKDAGWTNADMAEKSFHPASQVRWATIQTGSRTIGIARLELAPPQFCFVSDLIVQSKHRGRGLGEWFMQQIEQYCREQGIPRVLLQPTQGSQGFYDKLRFVSDPLVQGFLKKELGPARRRLPAH